MQHRSLRGEVVVDTSKFESWPLLRPDELTRLPTEVLRASVSDLETMCQQASGKDKRGEGQTSSSLYITPYGGQNPTTAFAHLLHPGN